MPEHVPTTEEVMLGFRVGPGVDERTGERLLQLLTRSQKERWLNAERARAWDEGAEYAWQSTGEGANAEYPGNDGEMSFREFCDVDSNPYRKGDSDD